MKGHENTWTKANGAKAPLPKPECCPRCAELEAALKRLTDVLGQVHILCDVGHGVRLEYAGAIKHACGVLERKT
jgi:hypothetical protein